MLAHSWSTSLKLRALRMATPRPSSTRANHSPSTAPMSASPTAMRAGGEQERQRVGEAEPPEDLPTVGVRRVRSTSSVAGSTERRPATALNRNGTKHTSVVMAMIGLMPAPSQITKAGA